ncbi:phage baseplate protein [Vibrio diazotrophicus]|uniref:phage baseplate protein n=1 Tax=Vibrio diazotrophicus TaxID=685 RepID=UPI000C9DDF62|nr:hypothetical protein [Vibrio diazotrophicus]PNH81336.1 hypothetical protein C1N27_07270 [Vibrio diazotrophicus]
MSMVYFKSNSGTLVCLDAETEIDVSLSNSVTSNSVMSGRTVSSDLVKGNKIVNVTGLVSYSKTSAQQGNPTPSEFIDLIEKAIDDKQRFTLYSVKNQKGKDLLKNYENLVIDSYGYTVDKYEDSITARITFQEVFVSESATKTTIKPVRSKDTQQALSDPTKGGKGTSTTVSSADQTRMVTNIRQDKYGTSWTVE